MSSTIPPSSSPTNAQTVNPVVQAAKGVLPNLKTGSILLAQVVRTEAPNPAQLKQGLQRIQLRLERQLISVSSSKPMQPGSTVRLQVTGPNQWALLPNLGAAKTTPNDLNAWMQAQRQSLPTQTKLGSVIRSLLAQSSNLANTAQNSALNPLAKILLASNRELLASVLSKQDLSDPAKILKAIKNSGLTFESKILKGHAQSGSNANKTSTAATNTAQQPSAATRGDLKSILLKTIAQLEQIKPAQAKALAATQQNPTANKAAQGSAHATHAKKGTGASKNVTSSVVTSNTVARNKNAEAPAANRPAAAQPRSANLAPLVATNTAPKTPAAPQATSSMAASIKASVAATQTITNQETKNLAAGKNSLEQGNAAQPARASAELLDLVLKQLNGGLAKILLQQLQTIGAQHQWSTLPNIQNSWVLDLPVLNNPHVDSFNIRVDQEEPQHNQENSQTETGWVVTLRFDLDKLGPISVKARLVGLQVSMDIWSQRPAVLSMIQKEFNQLEHALVAKGLDVKSLKCHSGELKEPRPIVERSLLHIET
ncbi:MAG: flagellar hook-length control protein FliK [Pseudomonadales bacterium]|nr:flagellar hook-length control protein FliK [Pseudomonadales bacterium]